MHHAASLNRQLLDQGGAAPGRTALALPKPRVYLNDLLRAARGGPVWG
jgi:hypothetical protein